jgi:uncharacterized Zn-finger protein
MENKPIVVCAHCDKKLFYCEAVGVCSCGDVVRAEHFEPVSDEVPKPEDGSLMDCPFCNTSFHLTRDLGDVTGIILKLADGSWWPHPPLTQN